MERPNEKISAKEFLKNLKIAAEKTFVGGQLVPRMVVYQSVNASAKLSRSQTFGVQGAISELKSNDADVFVKALSIAAFINTCK